MSSIEDIPSLRKDTGHWSCFRILPVTDERRESVANTLLWRVKCMLDRRLPTWMRLPSQLITVGNFPQSRLFQFFEVKIMLRMTCGTTRRNYEAVKQNWKLIRLLEKGTLWLIPWVISTSHWLNIGQGNRVHKLGYTIMWNFNGHYLYRILFTQWSFRRTNPMLRLLSQVCLTFFPNLLLTFSNPRAICTNVFWNATDKKFTRQILPETSVIEQL